ncbi:MAG: hypothetical protein PVF22_00860 [Candidatus Aminicenantes bacterium]
MKKSLTYSTFAIAVLSILFSSNCGALVGYSIVGTWDVNLTGQGEFLHWVLECTGSKNSGTAKTDAYGIQITGTFTRSGKDVTIEFSGAWGAITINWTFDYEDRADGTVVVNLTNQDTLTFEFTANRRNVHS